MRMFSLSRKQRFGIAIIGVTLTAALRLALEPLLGKELPFFLFAFPVILAAWFGGLWPGLLATALSLLLGDYLFLRPRGEILRYEDLDTLKRISLKGFFGVTFSLLAERLRDSVKGEMDSMERSRLLIEGIKDYAILMLDSQGRIISWNSGAERITGYTENEILGKDISAFFTPEKIEEGEPRRELQVAAIEGRCEEEGWRVRKDGSRYWASVITTALWDDAGRLRGFAKVTHDITQQKDIEKERERLLRREMAAREEAEAASRMKDEFLEAISHELRTPMTSILGWARLLSSGAVPDHHAHHAIDVIAKNAQLQTQLIDDLLDTSRIVAGGFQLDSRAVEIERVLQGAIDDVRPSAEAKRVTLSAVIDAQGEVVFGDANRLRQAILNLLSNAVKFSNEGGRVEARLARAGTKIEITVSDAGVGIEPQFLPHVFELFRQANGARTRRHGGLGLGLAITRHIAEIHGGDVSVSSPGKDQGATFKISLPLASAPRMPLAEDRRPISEGAQSKGRTPSEEGQRLDGVRVLLVEDNPVTMERLRSILNERGAEVITAASAPEALEALEQRPDALVSDLALPGQDGYDLIRQVRERGPELGGKIPAVAVMAGASAEDRARALASGFQMCVAMPINTDELIAIVASLTGHIRY